MWSVGELLEINAGKTDVICHRKAHGGRGTDDSTLDGAASTVTIELPKQDAATANYHVAGTAPSWGMSNVAQKIVLQLDWPAAQRWRAKRGLAPRDLSITLGFTRSNGL